MDDLVNKVVELARQVEDADIHLKLAGDKLLVRTPSGDTWFDILRLYRPSSESIKEAAALSTAERKSVLVLTAATKKAIEAAAPYNHITLPEGSTRLMAPGLALIRQTRTDATSTEKRTKLAGLTGVVAETLLQFPGKQWSIHQLAQWSKVSPALAHRVLTRLETAGLVTTKGGGPEKTRALSNVAGLAELWSEEDRPPIPTLRGYLYGSSPETVLKKVHHVYPTTVAGGVLAANIYQPVLTKTPLPIRLWMSPHVALGQLQEMGFEETDEGPNIEICQAKHDPWLVHAQLSDLPRVSPWRAWMEIAGAGGRTQELATELLSKLTHQWINTPMG